MFHSFFFNLVQEKWKMPNDDIKQEIVLYTHYTAKIAKPKN